MSAYAAAQAIPLPVRRGRSGPSERVAWRHVRRAVYLDESFPRRRRRAQAYRPVGAWRLVQRFLVVSGALAWLMVAAVVAAWVIGAWPR